MNIPIAFPFFSKRQPPTILLAADVGGTKSHLGLFRFEDGNFQLVREQVFASQTHPSFEAIARIFLKESIQPEVFSIAVAGPVLDGKAKATNLHWTIDAARLKKVFGLRALYLINDLRANAFGLPALQKHEFVQLQRGNTALKGNAAIIAPGSGLGEAGLFWDGKEHHPFASEGGHSDFAPRNSLDDALLKHLRQSYDHVSWERVVSGPGIAGIYQYLLEQRKKDPPAWMEKYIAQKEMASGISHGARDGDLLCKETMSLFFKYLAIESANLVLKLKATGGLYVGGGIVPKNIDILDRHQFLSHFRAMGRFEGFMKQVPVYVILNKHTALWGAAFYGVFAQRPSVEVEMEV